MSRRRCFDVKPAKIWIAGFLLITANSGPIAALAAESQTIKQFTVHWRQAGPASNTYRIEVSGFEAAAAQHLRESKLETPAWQRLFAVFASQGELLADVGLPPMLGTYSLNDSTVSFEPKFPLEPGVTYRASFDPGQLPNARTSGGNFVTSTFRIPAAVAMPTTIVTGIYPSARVLPENLLKFYLTFSAPMSRGHIYDHIHLLNESGQPVELPFLEIDEELWDPEMKRLTLFLDPGRIKRGLRPLEEVGPALENGKQYTLRIAREWRDASGAPLKVGFEKQFAVGAPDREPPDPTLWTIKPPKAVTGSPLDVIFPEPIDYALAQRVIYVATAMGLRVSGHVTLSDNERRWSFSPSQPWKAGQYRLVVQTTIEDLAGNNVGKTFEVDVFDKVDRLFTNSSVKLSFEIR